MAIFAFLPPFIYLFISWRGGEFERVLGALVGGLLFKLMVFVGGLLVIWRWSNLRLVEVAIVGIIWVLGFQIWEAVYFAGKKGNNL